MRKRGFELVGIGGIFVERVLVADRLRVLAIADVAIEPSARILATRLAGECHSPFAETAFERALIDGRKIADTADAEPLQVLLGDLADSRHFADFERCEETRFETRHDPQDAVRL